MTKIKDYLNLMRIRQWYKNLVVFLAIIFSEKLFDGELFLISILAFFSLSFVSSAGYIINDLVDRKKDALHPEKKNRPLASGKIGLNKAILALLLLLIIGLLIAKSINLTFLLIVILLFVLTQIYTLYLKNVLFADILTIASLFALRALSGALAVDVWVSPWLILCPFFLALFLVVGKRQADLSLMKTDGKRTRAILEHYNKQLTNQLVNFSTILLIVSYCLYSFLSEHPTLIYTVPLGIYLIFGFLNLINNGSDVARHPERVFKNKPLVIGMAIWVGLTLSIIYL
ncbi:decaprenyl-phosphate phosphoribosyltransferase [Candidatus Woesearchaeota archaeon CG_4_10_14_0_2_um_filter_33_13]|nr:MAG: decaprenyl-phosphate phosphoribosyltransferase [Candidatus Woesearchaeota archaeon CG_4_10_14_0_2_um_filter_33_13]